MKNEKKIFLISYLTIISPLRTIKSHIPCMHRHAYVAVNILFNSDKQKKMKEFCF